LFHNQIAGLFQVSLAALTGFADINWIANPHFDPGKHTSGSDHANWDHWHSGPGGNQRCAKIWLEQFPGMAPGSLRENTYNFSFFKKLNRGPDRGASDISRRTGKEPAIFITLQSKGILKSSALAIKCTFRLKAQTTATGSQ
jgi:hypothetical protein